MWDLHHGFHNTWEQDILMHLIAQCLIDLFIISENKVWIKETWDASIPFVELVEQAF